MSNGGETSKGLHRNHGELSQLNKCQLVLDSSQRWRTQFPLNVGFKTSSSLLEVSPGDPAGVACTCPSRRPGSVIVHGFLYRPRESRIHSISFCPHNSLRRVTLRPFTS